MSCRGRAGRLSCPGQRGNVKPGPLASSKGWSLPSGAPAGLRLYLEPTLASPAPCSCPLPSVPLPQLLSLRHICISSSAKKSPRTAHFQGRSAQSCCAKSGKMRAPLGSPRTQGRFASRCQGSPPIPLHHFPEERRPSWVKPRTQKKEASAESGKLRGAQPLRPRAEILEEGVQGNEATWTCPGGECSWAPILQPRPCSGPRSLHTVLPWLFPARCEHTVPAAQFPHSL